jgi:hypothetical protein
MESVRPVRLIPLDEIVRSLVFNLVLREVPQWELTIQLKVSSSAMYSYTNRTL